MSIVHVAAHTRLGRPVRASTRFTQRVLSARFGDRTVSYATPGMGRSATFRSGNRLFHPTSLSNRRIAHLLRTHLGGRF